MYGCLKSKIFVKYDFILVFSSKKKNIKSSLIMNGCLEKLQSILSITLTKTEKVTGLATKVGQYAALKTSKTK